MRTIVIAALLIFGCSTGLAGTDVDEARQTLKNYGLTRCVLEALPEESSALRQDLAGASRAYHFMGNGPHQILQDEKTLDMHDPYQQTRDFVLERYASTGSTMKSSNKKNVFHTCLSIYNSPEFDQFIRTQDAYLP